MINQHASKDDLLILCTEKTLLCYNKTKQCKLQDKHASCLEVLKNLKQFISL